MVFYIHSPGDTIRSSETNSNLNGIYKLDSEKAINDVSATNSGVLAGSSQVLIDKFLDATGQNNTVDIVNTDSLFTTYGYMCDGTPSSVIDTSNTSWATSSAYPHFYGVKIYAKDNTLLYKVTKADSCTATTCKIQDSAGVDLATASFSGNDAIFNYPLVINQTYNIGAYIDGVTNYTRTHKSPFSYPVNGTNINFTAPVGDAKHIFNIQSVTTNNFDEYSSFTDSIIQSVATTIPTGKTKVFVTPLMYEALSTGDSITADVSIDGGSTYTTNIPINEWTPITSANGTQLIVKANLLTGDGSTSPKVKGWRVLLE